MQVTYLGVRVPGLQEDLIVEGLPLRVVGHRHSKLPDAGHQVLGDALLVSLLATDSILQLDTNRNHSSSMSPMKPRPAGGDKYYTL